MVSIDCMLNDFQQFAAGGDAFIRRSHSGPVSQFIVSLLRLGVDAQKNIRGFLPDLRRIQRAVNHLRRTWLILGLRTFGAISSALLVRFALLSLAPTNASPKWEGLDRYFFSVSMICISVVSVWAVHRYLVFGWGVAKERLVWRIIVECLSVGRFLSPSLEGSPEMRRILLDELQTGIDGSPAREAFLFGRLQMISDEVESEVVTLAMLGAGLELVMFILGHMGFSVVPFLAWLESVSGVD